MSTQFRTRFIFHSNKITFFVFLNIFCCVFNQSEARLSILSRSLKPVNKVSIEFIAVSIIFLYSLMYCMSKHSEYVFLQLIFNLTSIRHGFRDYIIIMTHFKQIYYDFFFVSGALLASPTVFSLEMRQNQRISISKEEEYLARISLSRSHCVFYVLFVYSISMHSNENDLKARFFFPIQGCYVICVMEAVYNFQRI